MAEQPKPRKKFELGNDTGVANVVGERIGYQVPNNYWVPWMADDAALQMYNFGLGDRAMRFLNRIGFYLDEWQELVLRDMLTQRSDGRWATNEQLILAPRQNGKTAIVEARELVGIFLLGEKLILHTSVLFNSARESYFRLMAVITKFKVNGVKVLREAIHPRASNDRLSIEITDDNHPNFGARIVYMARGTANARGWSCDMAFLDEAYALDEETMAAVNFATSARKNPLVVYASSTGLDDSDELLKIRERGLNKRPRTALWEWCADSGCSLDDIEQWYKANPALGIRLTFEYTQDERERHGDKFFGRERLGLWADNQFRAVIPHEHWKQLCGCAGRMHPEHRPPEGGVGEPNQIVTPVVVSVDSTPDGSWTTISLAGWDAEAKVQVEVYKDGRGVAWAVDAVNELYHAAHNPPPLAVVVQAGATAGQLIPELEALGVEVIPFGLRDVSDACKFFYDRAMDFNLVHLGDSTLASALNGATQVFSGRMGGTKEDPEYRTWYWGRRDTTVDITGLCSATYAAWGLNRVRAEEKRDREDWQDKPMGGWVW